jgi:hypothetical protein
MRRRRLTRLALGACLALAVMSCLREPTVATVEVEARRQQPPRVRLEGRPVSVGLLTVYADDALLEVMPTALWNVQGIMVKAARDSFAAMGGQVEVVDYTGLDFQPWAEEGAKAERALDREGLTLKAWPGVPPEVTTSLVTVVKVVRLNMGAAHPDGTGVTMVVALLMSTWTREGQPVSTEILKATGNTGQPLKLQSNEADVEGYEALRRPHRRPLPEEWTAAFWMMLRELVGLHYFPLLSHEVPERFPLVGRADDAGVRAFQEGRYRDALAVWRRRYEADPRDHGALYNAAQFQALHGEDELALQLLSEARQVEDSRLYQEAWQRVQHRVSRVWRPEAARPRNSPPPGADPRTSAEAQCFLVESPLLLDIRWTRGVSLELDKPLLRERHPDRCGWPGVRCSIDYYQVKWFSGIWSERLFPGQNDLDEKANYDGSRRRKWSYFYDHTHRYRYCVHRVEG